jgi:uncharacterized protein with PIN domain
MRGGIVKNMKKCKCGGKLFEGEIESEIFVPKEFRKKIKVATCSKCGRIYADGKEIKLGN